MAGENPIVLGLQYVNNHMAEPVDSGAKVIALIVQWATKKGEIVPQAGLNPNRAAAEIGAKLGQSLSDPAKELKKFLGDIGAPWL